VADPGRKVLIVTPAPPGSLRGNRVTAERWAAFLRGLGHDVSVRERWEDEPYDVLVTLHARKSAAAVARHRDARPGTPVVVVLTGTDVYGDLEGDTEARASLEAADRIVVLQPLAVERLPPALRRRARVIHQSVAPVVQRARPREDVFEVCVLGHLRPVKDPLRAALAARRLPESSRVRIVHVGEAIEPGMDAEARAEMARNPRYRWLGGLPHDEALAVLARSGGHALTSRMEGGANAVCEAMVLGVPTVCTRIQGSVGLLGEDHPGYFPVGDTGALRDLLVRLETEPAFGDALVRHAAARAHVLSPEVERERLRELLAEL